MTPGHAYRVHFATLALVAVPLAGASLLGCKRGDASDTATAPSTSPPPAAAAPSNGVSDPARTPGEASGTAAAAENARGVKRYEVESGVIEFEFSGMQTGTETLYFKDFGRLELRETKTKLTLPNMPKLAATATNVHGMMLLRDGVMTNWDVATKQGTRIENPLDFYGGEEKLRGKNLTQFGMQMIRELGGVEAGSRNVAGLSCDLWKIEKLHATTCVHKGVSLDALVDMMGIKQRTTATKAEFGVKLDDAKFSVPEDVVVRKIDARDAMSAAGLGGPSSAPSGRKQGAPVSMKEALEVMKKLSKQSPAPSE
ncbi:MAG TPA: hypothetical protein VF989_10980 [Polyangiaceae bacterium]